MKTSFTARHFQASEDLKTYCLDSVEKLEHFFDRIMSCDIILEPVPDDDNPQKAELNVKVPGSFFNASESAPSYEQAIGDVVDNIARQLKKFKDKNYNNY